MQKQIEGDKQTQGNNKMIEEKDEQKKNRQIFLMKSRSEWALFLARNLWPLMSIRVSWMTTRHLETFSSPASSLHQLRMIIMWEIMIINVLEHLYSNIQHVSINKWWELQNKDLDHSL